MPWLEEKGLFPGLAIGRGIPMPCAAANGLFPGRGIPAVGATGATGAVGSTGAASTGFASSTVSSLAAAAFVVFALAGAFSTLGASSFGLAFGYAARSLFATGGAMVDEPLLTYSPNSFNLASASAVSIPSSLAMSYTRGSATLYLLSGTHPSQGRLIALRNSFRGAH
jgi:hypothetical protein